MARPSKDISDLRADAERTLTAIQGFVREGDIFVGKHFNARITERRGLTRAEVASLLGTPAPQRAEADVYDAVVIEYFSRG